MKTNYLLATFIGLFGLQAQAQFDKYYPGELTTINGEVLKGDILKTPEKQSIKEVFYRNASNEVTKYDVSNVASYTRGHEVFEKKAVGTSKVLMKQILGGDVKLFKHEYNFAAVGKTAQTNVMLKGAGSVITSKPHIKRNAYAKEGYGLGYYLEKDGVLTKIDKRNFKDQMSTYFSKNQPLVEKIKSKEYKYRDIVKAVKMFNS